LPVMFYSLACESFLHGQSFGKKIRKIKVVKVDGSEAGIGNYLLRWIFRVIEVLPYGVIAIIAILMNKKGQRVGDLAAGTTVIKIRENQTKAPFNFIPPEQDYIPVFSEAALLTDKELRLINQALQAKESENYHKVLGILAGKLKTHLNIQTKKYHEDFLTTLVKDYNSFHNKTGD
ncbi:MAG: RDD family protein, partial [Bacteroidetes bacterium]|nr:RDD family protein [Bacteroidota bacterium]